jgi:hypothetical protein
MNLIENTLVPIWHPRIILATITNAMPPLAQRSQNAGRQIVHLRFVHALTLISKSSSHHKKIGPDARGAAFSLYRPYKEFISWGLS